MGDVWDRHPELDPDDHDCEADPGCPIHSPEPLLAAFRRVQSMKQETQAESLQRENAELVKARLRAELPDADDKQIDRFYNLTLHGAAWIARMCVAHDLSFLEAWSVAEALSASVKEHSVPASPDRAVDLGVGAGLYTGLWIAFELMKDREPA